jgi:hypothetical protein
VQQVLECAVGRLIELNVGVHARRIKAQRYLVVAPLSVRATRRDVGLRVLKRYQMRVALHRECRAHVRELWAELKRADCEMSHIDVRNARGRLVFVQLSDRRALHVEPLYIEALGADSPGEKR